MVKKGTWGERPPLQQRAQGSTWVSINTWSLTAIESEIIHLDFRKGTPSAVSQPYRRSSRAAVESELHVSVHQVDGQKVPAGRIVAVEQRPVRRGRAKCHLKLDEGQVAARRLRPGDDGVRKHRLVEERRGQGETCAGEKTVRAQRAANVFFRRPERTRKEHAGTFTTCVKWSVK